MKYNLVKHMYFKRTDKHFLNNIYMVKTKKREGYEGNKITKYVLKDFQNSEKE